MRHFKQPTVVVLTVLLLVLGYSNFRTAKELKLEHQLRVEAIEQVENAWLGCQPAVYLRSSNDPINAISEGDLQYRETKTGRVCVFLKDGLYGTLWWSTVLEGKGKAHLEWNFVELGRYKW